MLVSYRIRFLLLQFWKETFHKNNSPRAQYVVTTDVGLALLLKKAESEPFRGLQAL